jgi:hypothetical protein
MLLQNKTVLIVEDEFLIAELLEDMLVELQANDQLVASVCDGISRCELWERGEIQSLE